MQDDELRGIEKRDITALEYVSQIDEMLEMHEFLADDDVMEMLDSAIRLLAQPHLKPETADRLLIQFQAASAKCAFLSVHYTTLKKGRAGTEENMKKNIYYTAADVFDKLAGSMKYIVRRTNA